jgi:hypothetical protein
MNLTRRILPALLFASLVPAPFHAQMTDPASLRVAFAHPPDDARIMMRWWWFGPAITKPEITAELEQMKAAGIGGVEVATLYPLALDDPATGFHNLSWLSDEHLDALRFAADEARRLGLRIDVTLCSGWPFGGPHIPVTQAAGKLRVESIPAPASHASIPVPAMEAGESLLAVFLASGTGADLHLSSVQQLPLPSATRLQLPSAEARDRVVLFFFSSRTGMAVKRPAAGAAGFVLDHYDSDAIENHLHTVGDRLLSAFGDHPPYAVFSDSLEDYGSDWTPRLLDEFRRRRGYDLKPLLPALVADAGPDTPAIRHDWGQTLTELANEDFLEPMHAWAQQHHTLLRSQTYGFPPVTLASNRFEDLPEGEGKATIDMWRQFSDTRWAASAGHLFGHNVISSETWTWLHSPAFRATPLDMKAEADLHFLQGINQLVGHGWPTSPADAVEPGWRMYAAGAFNAHNPWFPVMPDLAAYLQRVSFALRLGKPTNDVALLLPNDDVWASFKARVEDNKPTTSLLGFDETGSNITVDESMPAFLGETVIPQVLDAGFNLDFIDADSIETAGIPYKVLILPGVDRLPPHTYQEILDFARRGGIVLATRHLPSTAPGLKQAAEITADVQAISHDLFQSGVPTAHFLPDESTLGATLATALKPDFTTTPRTPEIGFIHRALPAGDIYFIANTSNQPRSFRATFRSAAPQAEFLDPFTGSTSASRGVENIQFDLAPYESRLVYLSYPSDVGPPITPPPPRPETARHDLSRDWAVSFPGRRQPVAMRTLGSWAEEETLRYFSGVASYRKTIEVPAQSLQPGRTVVLDFGPGTPVAKPDPLPHANMRAYLESPVREAATVYVNDRLAGYVWHPPYQLDLSRFLKLGANRLRIEVGNTAINSLAGASLPNYRLLRAKYGVEFEPQGMDHLEPLPSGILGPVTLIDYAQTKPK